MEKLQLKVYNGGKANKEKIQSERLLNKAAENVSYWIGQKLTIIDNKFTEKETNLFHRIVKDDPNQLFNDKIEFSLPIRKMLGSMYNKIRKEIEKDTGSRDEKLKENIIKRAFRYAAKQSYIRDDCPNLFADLADEIEKEKKLEITEEDKQRKAVM